jgi:hypothetical protein
MNMRTDGPATSFSGSPTLSPTKDYYGKPRDDEDDGFQLPFEISACSNFDVLADLLHAGCPRISFENPSSNIRSRQNGNHPYYEGEQEWVCQVNSFSFCFLGLRF